MNSPAGMITSASAGRLAAISPTKLDVDGPTATEAVGIPTREENKRRASSAASFHRVQITAPSAHSSIAWCDNSTVRRGGSPYVAVSR